MRTLKTLLFAAVVAGCTGSGAVRYSATAEVATPELVEVEPGVMVVADYDEPVFYSDNAYWRYDAGLWYRSPYYNRGWVQISTPPVAVRRIERPEMYVHYRAGARDRREARVNPPPPAPMNDRGPEIRDHHMTPPAPAPLPAAPPPDVRDRRGDQGNVRHDEDRRDDRDERREDRADRKAELREDKAERNEERREDKAERKDEKRDDKAQRRDEKRDDKAKRRDEKRDDKAEHGHH